MTALQIINNQSQLTSLDQEIRATIESSISENTAKAYKKTLKLFGNRNITEQSVLEFLQQRAGQGKSLNTIKQDLAALKFVAEARGGAANPVKNSAVIQRFMKGLSRLKGAAVKKAKPIKADKIRESLEKCPSYRDRALILLGFSGALRRSEIAEIRAVDIEFCTEGMLLTIRKSKTDQTGAGQTISIVNTLTIEAVKDWIDMSGLEGDDYLFPGRKEGSCLTGQAIANIIKKYVGTEYSAHGLRSGFMTSAADNGAGLEKIVEVSRHKDYRVAMGYIKEADKFNKHAGKGVL